MGSDFLSVCVFCASLLLRQDFEPLPRLSSELTVGYGTFTRRELRDEGTNEADVTARHVAVAFRWARPAEPGQGGGTPATEVGFQGTFPGAHDETAESGPGGASGNGNGRFENYALIGRKSLGRRLSVEAAGQQRRMVMTDLLTFADPDAPRDEARELIAERYDLALGLRLRWRGVEVAAHGTVQELYGKHDARSGRFAIKGDLAGGGADLRLRARGWTATLWGEYASGALTGDRRQAAGTPFLRVDEQAWTNAQGVTVARSFGRTELQLSGTWDRWQLPFAAFAVLGSETRALEAGSLADVRSDIWTAGIALRHRFSPRLAARIFLKASGGSEEVKLVAPGLPAQVVDVRIGFSHARRAFLLGGTVELGLGPR